MEVVSHWPIEESFLKSYRFPLYLSLLRVSLHIKSRWFPTSQGSSLKFGLFCLSAPQRDQLVFIYNIQDMDWRPLRTRIMLDKWFRLQHCLWSYFWTLKTLCLCTMNCASMILENINCLPMLLMRFVWGFGGFALYQEWLHLEFVMRDDHWFVDWLI